MQPFLPRRNAIVRLLEVQKAIEATLVRELAAIGITLAEFRLVGELISEPDGLRQGELARRLGVRAPTVSAAVARLKAAGLIEQAADGSDLRGRIVRLSSTAPVAAGFDVLARLEDTALRALSAQDRATFDHLLDTVTVALTPPEDP